MGAEQLTFKPVELLRLEHYGAPTSLDLTTLTLSLMLSTCTFTKLRGKHLKRVCDWGCNRFIYNIYKKYRGYIKKSSNIYFCSSTVPEIAHKKARI